MVGSISADRLPLTFLDAISQLSFHVKFKIIGYETSGYKGYINELLSYSEKLNIRKNIQYLGTIPIRSELLKICTQCDIGLSLIPLKSNNINLSNMLGASNKPFDYLSCGISIIIPNLSDWVDQFVSQGCAKSCDPNDSKNIAECLKWFFINKQKSKEMGIKGRNKIISDWNYEKQFEPVLNILNK